MVLTYPIVLLWAMEFIVFLCVRIFLPVWGHSREGEDEVFRAGGQEKHLHRLAGEIDADRAGGGEQDGAGPDRNPRLRMGG